METSFIKTMSNFLILVKTPLIFPIPWAPAPFPKSGAGALCVYDLYLDALIFELNTFYTYQKDLAV